ncbi:PAS domain S-box protein [candidate division KSB1 bacterium]|nr:PAS domain S-box protein [candidate division KSB1 bacterium]
MRDKILIFSGAMLIIIWLGYIAHVQYFRTKEKVIQLYSDKQVILAQQAAYSLEAYINERIKAMEVLADLPAVRKLVKKDIEKEFQRTYLKIKGFQHIIYIDTATIAQLGYPSGFPCPAKQSDQIRSKFMQIFRQARETRETMIFSKNVLVNNEVFICLLSPIYSNQNQFAGAIVGILNIRESLNSALTPIVGAEQNYAWVLNDSGFLVFHPKHEDLLLQNIFLDEKRCQKCHQNFDLEKAALKKQTSIGIKSNLNSVRHIIGFAPVNLENCSWFVAVSSPFNRVAEAIISLFRNFLILVIFMILTIIGGAIFINRINRKRLAALKEAEFLRNSASLREEKEAAESRYQFLVEQSPEPIFLCTSNKFLMHNQSFEKLFDITSAEIKSDDFTIKSLIVPEKLDYFLDKIRKFIQSGDPLLKISLEMLSKTQKRIEVEISIRKFMMGDEVAFQGIVHDVTQSRQVEREQRRKEHLALIGEMAARIAHEIKNPLASIQTGIQLLESQVAENSKEQNYFVRLRGEIQRVDKILKGLLTYAREDELEYQIVKLRPFIENFKSLIIPTLNKYQINLIQPETELSREIKIDPHKIEQVLWNIFLNAIQASSPGSNIYFDINQNENWIEIKVRDEGEGISEQHLQKIFFPFFSTRSQGSGLGLAICKKIVELHNGTLKIVSQLNHGTTVTIFLPEVQA